MSKSVIFIGDTADSSNWGCRATSLAMERLIEQKGGQITHRILLRDLEKPWLTLKRGKVGSPTNVPRPPLIKLDARTHNRIKHLAEHLPSRNFAPRTLKDLKAKLSRMESNPTYAEFFEKTSKADYVIINGEGIIYDFERKGRMTLLYALAAKKLLNKPVAMVNHGLELNDPNVREMANYVYQEMDDVVFRDEISAEHFEECTGIRHRWAGDAAYAYQPIDRETFAKYTSRPTTLAIYPHKVEHLDTSKPYVCLGGSSIYLRPDRPPYDPVPAYCEIAKGLLKRGLQVVLFGACHVDQVFLSKVAAELSLPMLGTTTPTQISVDVLGHAALVVSGRWHPTILASTGGTPAVLFTANTRKTAALIRQLNLNNKTFDALSIHLHVPEVLEAVDRMLEDPQSRERVLQSVAHLRSTTKEHVRVMD